MATQPKLAYGPTRASNQEWVQSNLTDAYKRVTGHRADLFDIDEAVIVAENENGIFAVKDGVYIGSKPIGSIFTVTTFHFPREVSERLWLDWQEDEEPTDLAMRAAESWAEKACSRLHISSCAGKDHRELLKRMLHIQPADPTGSATRESADSVHEAAPAKKKASAAAATPESATAPVMVLTDPQSPFPKPNHAGTKHHTAVGHAADNPDSNSLLQPNHAETPHQAGIGSAADSARAQGNRIKEQPDTDEQGFSIISMPPAPPAAPTSGAAHQGGVGNVVNPDARICTSANTQPVPNRSATNSGRPISGRPTHPGQSNPAGHHPSSPDRNPAPTQVSDNEKQTQPERKETMSQKERSNQAPKSKCFVVMASGAKGAKPVMVLTEQEDALDMAEALEAANAVLAESPAYDVVEAILRH